MPIKVVEIELSEGLRPIRVESVYDELYALVRFRGKPLRWLNFAIRPPVVTVAELREVIMSQVTGTLLPLAMTDEPERSDSFHDPAISVVVCTRDRAEQLCHCLEALIKVDYQNFEIIVVDNAPTNDLTTRVCAKLPVRYIREMTPGLDRARNRGVMEAKHELIAFTDDDARVDAGWLRALARSFSDPDVMAVTGFVAPSELETEAQIEFEINYGGMAHGFRRRRIQRGLLGEQDLLWSNRFGVGANMAFRREVFHSIGLFDLTLDVGTPSGGGGDLEMLHRVVSDGFTLVYEPSALVWHTHRRDRASLRRQIYQNGTGFGCYLLAAARRKTVRRSSVLKFALKDWFGGWVLKRLVRRGNMPRRYALQEFQGALRSPLAYRASRRASEKLQVKRTVTI